MFTGDGGVVGGMRESGRGPVLRYGLIGVCVTGPDPHSGRESSPLLALFSSVIPTVIGDS